MRLFEEILSEMGADEMSFGGAKIVLLAGRCGYFENVKSIVSFSAESVTLLLKKGEVRVEGEKLYIARYGGGDLLLRGDVRKVEIAEGGRV